MLAGTTYGKMRAAYRRLYPGRRGYRTYLRDLNRLLRPYGLKLEQARTARRIKGIRGRAIVAIRHSQKTGYWHWVVWEPGRGVR
jgi:hypothetical protein